MALTREKKEGIIKKIADELKRATSVVFVKFHGLSVSAASEMRRSMRGSGVSYTVVKKTLLRRVLKDAGIEGVLPDLEGEIALAYGVDTIEPAKSVATFEKKFGETLAMLGGILENRFISREEARSLSRVPSRHILLGQLVMVMYAPVTKTVRTLNEVNRSFVSALNQIAQIKN